MTPDETTPEEREATLRSMVLGLTLAEREILRTDSAVAGNTLNEAAIIILRDVWRNDLTLDAKRTLLDVHSLLMSLANGARATAELATEMDAGSTAH